MSIIYGKFGPEVKFGPKIGPFGTNGPNRTNGPNSDHNGSHASFVPVNIWRKNLCWIVVGTPVTFIGQFADF